jgi:hypothetical protein
MSFYLPFDTVSSLFIEICARAQTDCNRQFVCSRLNVLTTKTFYMQQRLLTFLFLLFFTTDFYAQEHADCVSAMDICEKKTYHIDKAGGEGRDRTEADMMTCFLNSENAGQAEENSTWIKFEIVKNGQLTFAITPHRVTDDLDWVVYRLAPSGDCATKKVVRCMAAGDGESLSLSSPCMGETGLRWGEADDSENAGCSDPDDNAWLTPLKVTKGEKYVLLVSNVTSKGPGFSIRFGGTAMLPCDKEKEKEPKKTKPDVVAKTVKPPKKEAPIAQTSAPLMIGGREVEVGDELKVKSRTIKVKVWDSQVEDGDIISIYLDDKKVINRIYLRLKPQEYEIQLPAGKEHYLTVYADDFGKAEPNTAKVSINDGVSEQIIDLVAGRSKQESVRIVTE